MNGRYEQAVIERLSDRFGGAENGGLAEVLMETAKNAVEDNLQDYTVTDAELRRTIDQLDRIIK